MDSVIRTSDLRVAFGAHQVLRGIDLPIARGSVTAIVGPSGCGKSTFLRSLNRLTDLVAGCRVQGSITIDGEDCGAMDPIALRRRVGMVFQKPNPFPMSIRENVLYGVKAHGIRSRRRHRETLEASLRHAVLWDEVKDRLDASALSLSGGQQQRLCIARSLATSPEVVLMDEPTSSLDPRSTARFEESILALRGDYTVVLVTHDVGQAHRVSDYLAFLYEGELVEFGPTRELFERPRSETTREYLAGGLVTKPPVGVSIEAERQLVATEVVAAGTAEVAAAPEAAAIP